MAVARAHIIRTSAVAVAAGVVALLTLAPRSLVAPARGAFMRAMDAVTDPLLFSLPYGQAEIILNTLLFVPLGAALALLLHRRAWPLAALAACAVAITVECAQGAIPGRVPDLDDVLWNSVGGAIGALVVAVPRLIAHAIRGARHTPRPRRTTFSAPVRHPGS